MTPPRILLLAGSLRTGSFNRRLAEAAERCIAAAGGDVEHITLRDYPLPIYDADLEEEEGVPETGRRLHARFAEAQGVFIASPEYNAGTPPILKMQSLGIEPSLSIDVECTMTADFFTQMRGMMTMQRMVVNQMVLDPGFATGNWWPTPNGTPPLLNTRDVLRFATMNGAKGLRLDQKTGSLTPGKEADIIILDATRLNVAPLNHVPGTVVSLMDRTNVETVIVAGKVRKWKGRLLDVDLNGLRSQLEASRDYVFGAAGIPQDLFGPN